MAKGRIRLVRGLANLLFKRPELKASVGGIVFFSLLLAGYFKLSVFGFLVLSASAILSAELSPFLCRIFKAELGRERSYFISLLSLSAAGVVSILMQTPTGASFALFLALVLSFRSIGLRAISGIGFFRSILPAAVQSLLVLAGFYLLLPVDVYFLSLLFSAAAVAAMELVLWFAGVPVRSVFGVGLPRLSYIVSSNIESGSPEIEGVFRRNAEKVKARVSVIGIRGRKGLKAIVAAPFIHPGPFGGIGSADMPQILCSGLSRKFGAEAFFAKGGGTHDDNLASSAEISKVSKTSERLVSKLDFSKKCTRFERADCALGFRFGGSVVGISTKPAADVEHEAGVGFVGEMEKHAKKAVYIEAHSSFSGDAVVVKGSPAYLGMRDSLGAVSERLSGTNEHPFSVGVGRSFPKLSAGDGMGAGGVGVILFKAGGKKFAFVFVDSNNVAEGMREKIISAFKARGISDAEVISSDTHSVSTLIERENPLCANGSRDLLVSSCMDCLRLAEKNLEPCSIGAASGLVDVSVFGAGASARIFKAVNSSALRLGASILFFVAIPILAGAS